ncbi:MAG: hypothetical protein ACLVB5_03990 [Christensenellales bacterium]
MYVGNYDFWYEYSQLALRQQKETNKQQRGRRSRSCRSSSRASPPTPAKSKQATSRKKLLDKLADGRTTTRLPPARYPYHRVQARIARSGNDIADRDRGLSKTVNGRQGARQHLLAC